MRGISGNVKLINNITLIKKAKDERRIILTFDLDFGELLAFSDDSLPSVIIFRLEKANPHYVLSMTVAVQ